MTNGRSFQFYKILFEKPIDARLIFSVDLSDLSVLKSNVEFLQHLHRESVFKHGFAPLWNKCEATDPYNISGIICSAPVLKAIGKLIKQKFNEKCSEETILAAVHRIIEDKMDPVLIKPFKVSKSRKASAIPKKEPENLVESKPIEEEVK
ncbi:MAG: hypothetical protein IPP73_18920 [Chitinophagaceae bacterium]|nr:hypothetical protein [Chitinophagaceae bacterium]